MVLGVNDEPAVISGGRTASDPKVKEENSRIRRVRWFDVAALRKRIQKMNAG
jgi:hypothetical protein